MWIKKTILMSFFLVVLGGVGACSKDQEADVRALLTRYFSLGETVYFEAKLECTAAMFKVQTDDIKSAARVNSDAGAALFEYKRSGIMALADPTKTPDEGFLELMNTDRVIGVAMQGASILAKNCMDEATISGFFYAMSNPSASMIFLRDGGAMAVLDPATRLVIYARGDG